MGLDDADHTHSSGSKKRGEALQSSFAATCINRTRFVTTQAEQPMLSVIHVTNTHCMLSICQTL